MNDLDHVLEWMQRLERDHADLRANFENMMRVGPVVAREHGKGVRIDTGTDDEPHKQPWGRMADRTGAASYTPKMGEHCLIFCPFGDPEQGIVIPFGHNDAHPDPAKDVDETVHHSRDGQDHRVKDGHVKDQADKKVSRWTGDQEPGDSPLGGGNFPHELQRQLQGLRAAITQNAHDIAAVHDATSKMREIAQKLIPGLAVLQPLLNGDPQSLKIAADAVLGKLESYVAMSFQQMVGKLTNGMLDNVLGLVQGFAQGDIGALLDEVEDLAAGAGLDVVAHLADARAAVADAAAGVEGALNDPLGAIEGVFAGTPAAAAFAGIQGRIGGALGAASSVAAGIGDLLDGQKNVTKGQTRSYRLGGY